MISDVICSGFANWSPKTWRNASRVTPSGCRTDFIIARNSIMIDRSGVIGLLFRGNVTGAMVLNNGFGAENASAVKSIALQSTALRGSKGPNRNNRYVSNQIAAGMKVVFQPSSDKAQNCFFKNHDEQGAPLRDLTDNRGGPCFPENAPAQQQ